MCYKCGTKGGDFDVVLIFEGRAKMLPFIKGGHFIANGYLLENLQRGKG